MIKLVRPCCEVSEELTFQRDDSDDAKIMAMEYFYPKDTDVWVKVVEIRRGASPKSPLFETTQASFLWDDLGEVRFWVLVTKLPKTGISG